ncbi:MAG: hypothetical protein ABIE74_06660 [Pseudomonadota bacterium]
MYFMVTKIIDEDTFEVTPEWKWKWHSGKRVKLKDLQMGIQSESGYKNSISKLAKMILGRCVILQNAVNIKRGRLLCEAFYNGINIGEALPKAS